MQWQMCVFGMSDLAVEVVSAARLKENLLALFSLRHCLKFHCVWDPTSSEYVGLFGVRALNSFGTYECCRSRKERAFMDNVRATYFDTKSVLKIRSFQIFVSQGVAGSFPWAALAFAALWLELIGFSHDVTAALMGCFVVATSLGGLFGGFMGDYLAIRLPNAGRIILSQISAGSGIPLGALLLLGLPKDPSVPALYGAVMFLMGFCIAWNGSATNGYGAINANQLLLVTLRSAAFLH